MGAPSIGMSNGPSRLGQFDEAFGGLVPVVNPEVEGSPVDGQEAAAAAEELQGLERVVWAEVNVPPGGMKGSDLEHDNEGA